MAGGTKTPEFLSKFPIGQIPTIEDGDFRLGEGSAIMQYLCEKHKWDQWWPQGNDATSLQNRAKINEYLSYQHYGTRLLSRRIAFKLFKKQFFKEDYKESMDELRAIAFENINDFETKCLRSGPFIGEIASPTIADLFAYAEIYQMVCMGVFTTSELSPKMQSWISSLQELPAHDDVHATISKLGAAIISGNTK